MTAVTAANVLGLSRRQIHRLLKTFQSKGAAAIRHKARGRRSNNLIAPCQPRRRRTPCGPFFRPTVQFTGRVKRANRALQDRLVKEQRLAGISDMEAGSAYLQGSKIVTTPGLPSPLPGPTTCTAPSRWSRIGSLPFSQMRRSPTTLRPAENFPCRSTISIRKRSRT